MVAPEDPRFHPTDRWHRETALPHWGARVIDEIRRHLEAAGLVVQVQSMETAGNTER